MILIRKMESTDCKRILQYAVSSKELYKDISSHDKEIIKASLLKEQGYLCAYCMRRLGDDQKVKIEHIAPQSVYPEKSLVYRNMLAVCDGNEGKPYALQTCDTHKGNAEIKADPTDPAVIKTIRYRKTGEIFSVNPRINRDLNEVLNLNAPGSYLVQSRRNALDAIRKSIIRCQNRGKSVHVLLNKLDQIYHSDSSETKLKPYTGIIRWYIKRELKQYD